MILDEVLPRWDKRERHGIALDVPPATALRAATEVTWGEVPAFRALMFAFSVGTARLPVGEPVLAMFIAAGMRELGRSDDEIVVGGIQRFPRNRGPVPTVVDRLGDIDEPYLLALAVNFRHGGGRLTTETRVRATDDGTRRWFAAYWFVIRGGSGFIRRVWLRGIRRRALRG